MPIRVALNHRTDYQYDRPVTFGPHVVRLRPAPHTRTPIKSYSLNIDVGDHYLNWQQDPYGNYLARLLMNEPSRRFTVTVNLVAEMTVINPFEFFMDPEAEMYPFSYTPTTLKDLSPFLNVSPVFDGSALGQFLSKVDRSPRKTIDFLVDLNRIVQEEINYSVRLEPGVQTCEETLTKKNGSCRDSAWLLVNVLRHLGFASRFVSGYLIQLKPDQKSLDGPSGSETDFTDLHAWTEVYLPGGGWIGLDPTSGLLAGEGHIPLACTPEPIGAAAITGAVSKAECEFDFSMSVHRLHEDPRVTKPYTEEQWEQINTLGHKVDQELARSDVRLTMGGEPTFVSIDDMEGEEWQTAAVGPDKRRLAGDLLWKLKSRFAPGSMLHFGQGKWYPGEPLPRWSLGCYWRTDGQPVWKDESLIADPSNGGNATPDDARRFAKALAARLGTNPDHVTDAHEDVLYYTWKEKRLPANVDLRDSKLESEEERTRLARLIEQGLTSPVGCVLPIRRVWWDANPYWESGLWQVRADEMFLMPGDSPMGLRLPLDSLLWYEKAELEAAGYPVDMLAPRESLPAYHHLREQVVARHGAPRRTPEPVLQPSGGGSDFGAPAEDNRRGGVWGENPYDRSGFDNSGFNRNNGLPVNPSDWASTPQAEGAVDPSGVVRTALCVEPRDGVLYLFMPPLDRLEDYLDLVAAAEDTAAELGHPIALEGYTPPNDPRLKNLKVTPDPGVIEVNIQPAADWQELTDITTGVYEDARQSRLGTEKFDLDGTHTGTGGGNHLVLGGASTMDSPFLRRPDLLRSLVGYWHNHPSLTYLLSGMFVGPTSQAPRADEGRRDAIYELEIAFQQIDALTANGRHCPPWLVDRVFRHLLVDGVGNTHRAEFCIDKLYSPDSATGRLGLVEFRGFEMPPHAQMSLAQQLLVRALVARFWNEPYREKLVAWDTTLHDRFMLPHFVKQDFAHVVEECQRAGFDLKPEWFGPHLEFRFPVIGEFTQDSVRVELRKAVEPWYVLGEENTGGGTARYVDSSVERLQVLVQGMTSPRYALTCNGRATPLHPTGQQGEYVAGVRYRGWQPPSCLHPTIPVDTPLAFDLVDTWLGRSIGGCSYHVGHPGGLNPGSFPVNAFEAESRRASRFFTMGHRGGVLNPAPAEPNADYPLTLDLRQNRTTAS